jgi:hypothetical protein
VVSAGTRPLRGGTFSRPRYWCYPSGDRRHPEAHRFTEPHQHRTSQHPAGAACPECRVLPPRTQGSLVPVTWTFTAREIAEGLVQVGRGTPYRRSGTNVRVAARRYRTDAAGLPVPSRDGTLVQRWLDLYGPLVMEPFEHRRWPSVLLLDAIPIRERNTDEEGRATPATAKGAILMAMGYTEPLTQRLRPQRPAEGEDPHWRWEGERRYPHLWRMSLSGGLDAPSWYDFLGSLDGEPGWIVCDGDTAIPAAIAERWGNRPVVYACEGHLRMNFLDAARGDKIAPAAAEALLHHAFIDPEHWWRFVREVAAMPAAGRRRITAWIERRHDLVLAQMSRRVPGLPHSIGALESATTTVGAWIGERKRVFQNVRRTNIMLGLMRAEIAGHADPAAYARLIHDRIEEAGRRPQVPWHAGEDVQGRQGLFALCDAARARGEAYERMNAVDRKNRSVEARVAAANAYRASLGFPPLRVNRAAQQVSVIVSGDMLSDHPEIAREWDYEANGDLRPEHVKAGSRKEHRHWACLRNPAHKWPASVDQRCIRLSGCPECAREAFSGGAAPGRTLDDILAEAPPVSEPVPLPPLPEPAWLNEPAEPFF